jgi:hypothetical protein
MYVDAPTPEFELICVLELAECTQNKEPGGVTVSVLISTIGEYHPVRFEVLQSMDNLFS